MLERIRTYGSFVRFSHSVFALPFALAGALLAIRGRSLAEFVAGPFVWILIAMVAPRGAARPGDASRGDGVRRDRINRVRHRRVAAQSDLLRALAGRARHRLLVF